MYRTISGMIGKGSVNHNTRTFSAKNVDKERSSENVEFCNADIKTVYHQLFDEALEKYNAKQKRSDRKIDDYYEKIRQGKQEKLFHEVIFQIGNKDDMNARSEEGQLAKTILTEFMQSFQSRNPNLHVFSAHLHMDEETPHLHIDFVPIIHNSKRGLETRVSLKGALAEQGFSGGTKGATEWNQWMNSEKEELAMVMGNFGVKWLQKGTHEKHLSVLDFQKQERSREVDELEEKIAISGMQLDTLRDQIDVIMNSKIELEKNIYAYDINEEWKLPEAGKLQTAKSYRDKIVEPLIKGLKDVIRSLMIQVTELTKEVERISKNDHSKAMALEHYRKSFKQDKDKIQRLEEKVDDFNCLKRYFGANKVQEMIDYARKIEQANREQRMPQRKWDMDLDR